jgi:protein TonB
VVDKNGNITDVKTLKAVKGGPNLDKEAIRLIKSMPPWVPGKKDGRFVAVQYTLPVTFNLH